MGRLRRTSKALERAVTRSSNLKAIDPALDFGNNLNITKFDAGIEELRAALDEYNQTLATIDELNEKVSRLEKSISDTNARMLTGVATRWGKDSTQYEQAGGVRTSERRRATKKGPKT